MVTERNNNTAQQQNSAPALDVEKIAKKALALAMMGEKNIVLDRFDLTLAITEIVHALGEFITPFGTEEILKHMEKYAVGEGLHALYIIVPDAAVDIVRSLNRDFIEAARTVLLYANNEDWWENLARVIEKYVTDKVREKYDRNWSAAKELLSRAAEAGFGVETIKRGDGTLEYKIAAPTGNSTSVYYNVDGCVYAIGYDPLWYVEYRFELCHDSGGQK
ncbi:hypothetical protein [Pyrobaculum sp.]|uniref:hypothetical protein n=1 Tax=Pyrobaculum sp. TaxID=2004705 RepID=UPI003D1022E8